MTRQRRVADPRHFRVRLQVLRHLERVVIDAVHAQRQRFNALQNQKGVERRQRRAGIAQRHHAGTANVGSRAQRFGIDHAVVARVGFVQAFEFGFVVGPGELAGVNDGPANAVAVATEVFGQRLHNDVGTMLDRAQQVRGGYRVVHNQRHAVAVGYVGDRSNVGHAPLRVTDRFDVNRLGLVVNLGFQRRQVTRVDKAHGDARERKRMRKQVVGAAVERAAGHNVVTYFGNGLDRIRHRRRARRQRQRGNTAFKRGDALLKHVVGRVHDPGVNVASHLQVKQVSTVLRAVKGVGDRLVDRHRHRLGGRVGAVTRVNRFGFKFPGCRHKVFPKVDEARAALYQAFACFPTIDW